jgi:hypothetical protein
MNDMQPDYVTYDTKQREEFLSQTGNFSPGERDAFHKLCQNWQERIPYNRFIGLVNRGDGATTSELHSLMKKLQTQGYGLIRTKVHEGQRSRDTIVLSECFSRRFVSEYLDELFNDLLESIGSPLPLLSTVTENLPGFPVQELTYVSSDRLAQEYTTPDEPDMPLAVETIDGDRILVTRGKLRPCVTVSMLKLRYYLGSASLLEMLARFMDTSLIALKQKIGDKDPQLWLGVTQKIIDKRKEIDALRNVRVDNNFFHAAWLLKRLLESQMTEAEEKKREAENRRVDLDAIALAVKEAPQGWMEQDQLTRTIDGLQEKYEKSIDSFREEFYDKYVHSQGRNSLPKIVLLDGRYIHRDRVFPLFLAHFREAESELKPYFTALMESQLRRGSPGDDTTFVDLENFDNAILEYVRKQSPLLASMIEKPAVLAEGMILHAKQNKLVKDVTELKQRLAVYFDPETMKPLPLHEWFNLRMLELFETAFERLPIWRRIWIRITGRYESFRGRYVSQSTIRRQERQYDSVPRNRDERKQLSRREDSSGRGRTGASGRGKPSYRRERAGTGRARGTGTSAAASAQEQKKRGYSKKQVDSAWEQFGSSIRKKD